MRRQNDKRVSIFMLTLVYLVRLAGFEPTTPWFVAKYSIQLSYSRNGSSARSLRKVPKNESLVR
jgi:hypothetical protein